MRRECQTTNSVSSPDLPPSLKLRRLLSAKPRRSLGGGGIGRSSIPETDEVTSDASGILDAAFAGHDSGGDVIQQPRGRILPELCFGLALEREGAGNAGCLAHPQPRVHW